MLKRFDQYQDDSNFNLPEVTLSIQLSSFCGHRTVDFLINLLQDQAICRRLLFRPVIEKTDFMERPSEGFVVDIDPSKPLGEIHLNGKNVISKYDGRIWEIYINFSNSHK
jgi:hypothetical protein